ncbi:M1 family metallopeptidase [Caldithrix abyssi]|nr:M1 family metallopeptidase [Caldithrix abyssi]
MRLKAICFSLLIFTMAFSQKPYFQQEVHYKIDVTLNVLAKTYSGHERLTYINHSPDTLTYVWLHLYPNAYRNNNTPFARQQMEQRISQFYFSDSAARGYLKLTALRSNGKQLSYSLKNDAIDEAKIDLPLPLFPGDTITLEIDFEGKFPRVFSRMGTWDGYYFAATQWYPKMVVYDRLGWHPDSYLDLGEFYGEYGTFDVKITLPELFVIDATGMLKDDVAEETFMRQLADTTRYFLNLDKADRKQFIKNWKHDRERQLDLSKTKTVHFYAENVHDFAWFAGLHYMVLRKIHNGGVLTNVLVHPESAYNWRHVPDYVKKTVSFYGKMVGPYQYPKASVVQGQLRAGGGMEYPMITIISIPHSDWENFLEMVVMHEVGHNWFMGMLGSDERASTFLDEGVNSFVELKYLEHYYGKYNLTNFKKLFFGLDILRDLGDWQLLQMAFGTKVSERTDLPLDLRAEEYDRSNYGVINYQKGALMLLALEEYLTPPVFWKGMREYFARWNGKHPTVNDFFQTMEEVSGKELDWFVEDWYHSTRYCDFVIKTVKKKREGDSLKIEVWVENKGTMKDMPAPVRVVSASGDTLQKWWNGNPEQPLVFKTKDKPLKIEVNPRHSIFEMSYLNNQAGLPPVEIHFVPQIPSFETYEVIILPYYWYESFVDKHRLGGMIWGGNPILKQWFWTGKAYYATKTKRHGYRLTLTNRFHLPLANYTDVKAEWFDVDGMRKKGLYFSNYFQRRGKDYPKKYLNFALEAVDLYRGDYYESSMFQKARYGVITMEGKYLTGKMLTGLSAVFRLQKGMQLAGSKTNYLKVEIGGNWWARVSKNSWFRLEGYWANIWGAAYPRQESIFAGGEIDPRHQKFVFSRRGSLAPNRHYTLGQGMKMYGYGDPDNRYFLGKSGAALSLTVKPWKYLPVMYGSGAALGQKSMGLKGNQLFAEAGLKFNVASIEMIFPLYISDPAPGEKHLAFRFLLNYSFRLSFGF